MKQKIKPFAYIHPMPVVVIAAVQGDDCDFTTVSNIGIASVAPPIIMVSIHEDNYMAGLIERVNCFTVNVPTPELLDEVDACGMASALTKDKTSIFDYTVDGDYVYIEDMPISLKCQVSNTMTIGYRKVFFAEVVETLVDKPLILDHDLEGAVDFSQLITIGYGLDHFYYALAGEQIGEGHMEGEDILTGLEDKSDFNIL